MTSLNDFPPDIRDAAAKAHAEYADARVKDNLGVIIARAINAERERCLPLMESQYRAGMKSGWNLGVAQDEEGYQQRMRYEGGRSNVG